MVGIIGWPLSHSLSPLMQNTAFIEAGLHDWHYISISVPTYPSTRIKEAILGLRALKFRGANITIPYKEVILSYLDHLHESAQNIGAVNTILIDDEKLIGYNTDGIGFIKDLVENHIDPQHKNILILGAGGAAKAILYALLDHGCNDITILNRTITKANALVKQFKPRFPQANINSGHLSDALSIKADFIINTTSVGMNDDLYPLNESMRFSSEQIVYDIIYQPRMTPLLTKAQHDGAKVINGLGMLLYQGAEAFSIWTGKKANIDMMKKCLNNFA